MSGNYIGTPWEDPRFAQGSKFFKFANVGDTIIGVLRAWSEDEFPEEDGKPARPYPVMHLDTAQGEQELGLTLVDLKAQVFAAKPRIGDTITARYLRDGKPKLFHVEVTRAVLTPPPPPHPPMDPTRSAAAVPAGLPVPTGFTTDTGPMIGANLNNPVYGQPGAAGYGPPSQEVAPF